MFSKPKPITLKNEKQKKIEKKNNTKKQKQKQNKKQITTCGTTPMK